MEHIWMVRKTFGDEHLPVAYLHSGDALQQIEADEQRLKKAFVVDAYRDSRDPLIWTHPRELYFSVWDGPSSRLLWSDREFVYISGAAKIQRKDIKYINCSILENENEISVKLDLHDGASCLVASRTLDVPSYDVTYDAIDLDFDASWAIFLSMDLSSWLGVLRRDTGSNAREPYLSNKSLLSEQHPLHRYCREAGVIVRNHFRVVSDVERITHKDFDNFFEAKKYCDWMIRSYSGDYATISVLFNESYRSIYLGK